MHDAPGIDNERRTLAGELAAVTGIGLAAAEQALTLFHERPPAARRNLVSNLATVAHLTALLAAIPAAERHDHLTRPQADGSMQLYQLLTGQLARVTGQLCDAAAGPYDVSWDSNSPSLRSSLRGQIPASARAGDVLTGGDGGGTRIVIAVVADDDGVLTGEEVPGSWRDPPLEDVWLATYRRLESLYPEAIPSLRGGEDQVGR